MSGKSQVGRPVEASLDNRVDARSREVCFACPLPECKERDPRCLVFGEAAGEARVPFPNTVLRPARLEIERRYRAARQTRMEL